MPALDQCPGQVDGVPLGSAASRVSMQNDQRNFHNAEPTRITSLAPAEAGSAMNPELMRRVSLKVLADPGRAAPVRADTARLFSSNLTCYTRERFGKYRAGLPLVARSV